MLRRLLLGLLALPIACPLLPAGTPGQDAGWGGVPQDVQRLPPVEPLPTEEALPSAECVEPSAIAPEAPIKLWEGSFELGLDGTEGNSQTFNYRLGLNAKRTVPGRVLTLDLDYRKNSTDSGETAHRALLDWRHEWLLPDSPWSVFVHGTVDYDEFKAFDLRVTADAGLGYSLIETEHTSLTARTGGGFSHEVGGPDDSYVPEAVFGLDFEHQLNRRQKLSASVEYTPEVTDFGNYRLMARAAWELLIDEQMNLSLKLSVLDRYDSTPHGAKPNDLDYAAVLLWKF